MSWLSFLRLLWSSYRAALEEGALEEVRCLLVVFLFVHMLASLPVFPADATHEKDGQDDDDGFYAAQRRFAFSASSAVYISRGDSVIVMKKTLNLKRRYNLFRSFSLSLSGAHTFSLCGEQVARPADCRKRWRRSRTRRKQEKWQHIYETIGPRNH